MLTWLKPCHEPWSLAWQPSYLSVATDAAGHCSDVLLKITSLVSTDEASGFTLIRVETAS